MIKKTNRLEVYHVKKSKGCHDCTLVVSCDNIAQPGGNPENENPSGENPSGENPSGENPSGENPSGENPSGENPSGENPSGENLSADPLSGHTYGIKYMSQSGITISRQGTTIVIVDSNGTEEISKVDSTYKSVKNGTDITSTYQPGVLETKYTNFYKQLDTKVSFDKGTSTTQNPESGEPKTGTYTINENTVVMNDGTNSLSFTTDDDWKTFTMTTPFVLAYTRL